MPGNRWKIGQEWHAGARENHDLRRLAELLALLPSFQLGQVVVADEVVELRPEDAARETTARYRP